MKSRQLPSDESSVRLKARGRVSEQTCKQDRARTRSGSIRFYALVFRCLQNLAAAKYDKAVEETSHIQDVLDSIPDIYGLTPDSVRTLREIAVMAVRIKLGHQSAAACARSSEGRSEAAAYSVMALLDTGATGTLEFMKDLLSSYIRAPLLGSCFNCNTENLQPAEPLQIKCLKCGKGGATPLWRRSGYRISKYKPTS
ncbi:hypothetical protein MGG_16547 [Pyricularia oryzae 70-15]|uniref:Uncharacterized protein n=1 Tax=Pyricularia oryzae (strain 70-15 / ATCC MYA-4617 / FGSC 8958) TaxID=242507 RepID=G4MLH7_PYRO7|nr:uncharacterized protein MGG_16547 [Pyricularia oryzae 70-15]EHA58498.1 hypothetical protein MGG_16547 [Pyricularia oryzae 70-15]